MKIIFAHWVQSLVFFSPLKFRSFLVSTLRRFFTVLKTVFSRFGFLLLIDVALFIVFGNAIFKILNLPIKVASPTASFFYIFVILLMEINWFIFSTLTLLFIRKKENTEPLVYIKQTFFVYLQLLMLFYFILFVCMALFVSLGIIKIPQLPWICIAGYMIIKMLAIFYWLDSSMNLKDTFIALEKAVNIILYNLPVFVFLIFTLWSFDIGVKILFFGVTQTFDSHSVILTCKMEQLIKSCPTSLSVFPFLCFRYLLFFLKALWACSVFVLYDQKKGIVYTKSCFGVLQGQQPPL